MKEKIEYYISTALLNDGQVEETVEYHPDYKELSSLKKKVLVGMTQREYDIYMKKRGVDRMLFLREKCIEQVQRDVRTVLDETETDYRFYAD